MGACFSLPNHCSPEYLMILIFFLVDLCKLLCKTGERSRVFWGPHSAQPLVRAQECHGAAMFLLQEAWHRQGRGCCTSPDCCNPQLVLEHGEQISPWAGPCLPTDMVYVCMCVHLSLPTEFSTYWLLLTEPGERGLQCCSALLPWVKDTSTRGYLLGFMDVTWYGWSH